jgi:Kef-type K+ transport system membrane component KefB
MSDYIRTAQKDAGLAMRRTTILYLLLMVVIALPGVWVLRNGSALVGPGALVEKPAVEHVQESAVQALVSGVGQNLAEPLSRFFLQLLIIIAATRVAARVSARFGQPAVVGEMVAGILLGPSLFGTFAPDAFALVFPPASFGVLKLISQIGVCLFMFVVGMELDAGRVRAQTALLVSHASIMFPYLLGVVLAWFLYTSYAMPGATFISFALFIGISLSITAFPVLARILQERGMSNTPLGGMAITCAAVGDVTAWCILAFVVATARATGIASSALNLLLVALFIAVMRLVVKKALARALEGELLDESLSKGAFAMVFCVVVGAALCTEIIGIHALFGAFMAGLIMPRIGGFREKVSLRVETFSSVLLLPLFFTFTGLRTQIGVLNDVSSWLVCAGIILVATIGKFGGTAFAARLTGMPWGESLQLGALMNTRGLMELIALNIGYDLGILSPRIFTMLVIMALVTTILTGPLLTFLQRNSGDACRPATAE